MFAASIRSPFVDSVLVKRLLGIPRMVHGFHIMCKYGQNQPFKDTVNSSVAYCTGQKCYQSSSFPTIKDQERLTPKNKIAGNASRTMEEMWRVCADIHVSTRCVWKPVVKRSLNDSGR